LHLEWVFFIHKPWFVKIPLKCFKKCKNFFLNFKQGENSFCASADLCFFGTPDLFLNFINSNAGFPAVDIFLHQLCWAMPDTFGHKDSVLQVYLPCLWELICKTVCPQDFWELFFAFLFGISKVCKS
jgi:hypothetical protein